MADNICPICHAPVGATQRSCANCGVDLALATVTTELAILSGGKGHLQEPPASPEVLVPRLGDHLVERGFLTKESLGQALEFQKANSNNGTSLLIGQALIQLGFIDQHTLDRAIAQQIFRLHSALQKANQVLEERVAARTRDLQTAMNRLAELNQLKANFVANISHELRTPLTHIKGYTEMLRDSSLGPINEEQEIAFKVMDRSIHKLETLIDDLIRFSEDAQQEFKLHLQSMPPRYLVRNAFNLAKQKSGSKDRRLTLAVADGLPNVLCDQEKISWVILHLIENAVKFSPQDGKIHVEAGLEDRHVIITVADTGIGIPDDKIDEIFDPFHQLDTSTTRKYAGTGLGLALVKRILDAHHAAIRVRSAPGKGTAVSFFLPVTDQKTIA